MDTNIYENAIKDIKSILYDVISLEQDNLSSLEEKVLKKQDEERKIIEDKIALKKNTLNNLRKNMLSITKNIETLDNSNKNIDFIAKENIDKEEFKNPVEKEDPEEISNVIEENPETEMSKEESNVNETSSEEAEDVNEDSNDIEENPKEEITIEETPNEIKEESNANETPSEAATEDVNENSNIIEETPETPSINDIPTIEEPKETSKAKYRFIKTTKNATKAILVTKEQDENLTKSQEKQIYIQEVKENLKDLNSFNQNDTYVQNQAKIKQQQFNEELTKELNKQKELGIEKERQIEDLMVKANIYTNEGETEKAQIIYDKINELQDNEEKSEEEGPVMIKAA